MSLRYSAPAIDKTEFNCPRCGVRSTQRWNDLYLKRLTKGETPRLITPQWLADFLKDSDERQLNVQPHVLNELRAMADGDILVSSTETIYDAPLILNASIAQCLHCEGISVWLHNEMAFPQGGEVSCHEDMPQRSKRTFDEASKILSASPRASAALARLALQELCVELDCKTDKLDNQIGELVARGMPDEIQKMLDAVRVIGNNAVHPGEIDLTDDRDTARFVLECMNRIVQRLITEKREVDQLYGILPEGARAAIERRNEKISQKSAADAKNGS